MELSNIIVVCDFGYIEGGASKVAITSAVYLSNLYNVTFFCGSDVKDETLKVSNVRIVSINDQDILHDNNRIRAFCKGLWNIEAYRSLNRLLTEFSPANTIVHIHSWTKVLSSSIFRVLAQQNFKVVLTLHDYFQICANGGLFNYKNLQKCHLKPQSRACFFCNCDSRRYLHKLWRYLRLDIQKREVKTIGNLNLVYISNLNKYLLNPYLEGIAKCSTLIKNPIDINVNHLSDVGKNKSYIYMGRVSEEKGVRLFCEAIHSLKLKAIVIGDGPIRKDLESEFKDISFVGWKSGKDKEEFIYQGKALVFPSLWYEGAPLTIVEAKSYGLPCIVASDCAATEDIIENKEGLIFKSGDVESLKNAILKLESSDIKLMQRDIVENFNPSFYQMKRYARDIVSLYAAVLSQ